ncbi:hypothetical protein ACFL6T_02520 [Candidatus Zixiibacteriota bacterium]
MMSDPASRESSAIPRLLGELLSDLRVQDCLWVGLMEWDLRIQSVVLRPRLDAEGGTRSNGWVLCVGMGPGVRLEVMAGVEGAPVEEVRLVVAPDIAPDLLRRTCWGSHSFPSDATSNHRGS